MLIERRKDFASKTVYQNPNHWGCLHCYHISGKFINRNCSTWALNTWNREDKKLIFNHFLYLVNWEWQSTTYWGCENRGCGSSGLHVWCDTIVKDTNSHSHAPNAARIEVLTKVDKLKTTSYLVPRSAIVFNTLQLPESAKVQLPKISSRKRHLRNKLIDNIAAPHKHERDFRGILPKLFGGTFSDTAYPNNIPKTILWNCDVFLSYPSTKWYKISKCYSSPQLRTVKVRSLNTSRIHGLLARGWTSRERPKSAAYLRLKNSKRTSKCRSISSTVPEKPKSWTELAHQRGHFEIFHLFCGKSSKKLMEEHFWWKTLFLKKISQCRKNWKGDHFGIFQHPFCRKTPKKLKGNPLGIFFFEKKSHRAKNTLRQYLWVS